MHENMLNKLKKSSISATDIASQFWCEKQMELNYLYGKRVTLQMERGKKIHEDLQAEVYVPLAVEPVTYADMLYKTAYENYMALKTLSEKGVCREVHIYGSLNGYKIVGQVDELRKEGDKVKIVELKTINESNGSKLDAAKTKPHIVQIMLYKKLIDDIRQRKYELSNFANSYGIRRLNLSEPFERGLRAIGIKEELINIEKMFELMFDAFYSMPDTSDKLEIYYIDRFSGRQVSSIIINYNEEAINKDLAFALKYWKGEREAMPVPSSETWKCNFCRFYGKECKVWWKG